MNALARHFLRLQLGCVLLFACLYYVSDTMVARYASACRRLRLVNGAYQVRDSNTIGYYLWFSLMTQTTVGYTGIIDEDTGKRIAFSKINNRVYVVVNVLQMCSILMVAASVLHAGSSALADA